MLSNSRLPDMIIRVRHLLWLAVMFGLVQMTSAE